MFSQYRYFVPLSLLVFGLSTNLNAQNPPSINPDSGTVSGNPKLEAAAKKFVGSWIMFTPQWGSWDVEFKKAFEAPDGKVQLRAFDNYDPAKPARLTVELSDEGGLVFHYKRPKCKGMPDVTEDGIHLMKFKPINDTASKLEAVMLSKDCSLQAVVQLVKN